MPRVGKIEQLTREAVQTMLGFELAHVGVNAENEEEALKAANRFAFISVCLQRLATAPYSPVQPLR